MNFDFASLKEDANYCESMGRGIWLMDNHRWAFYVWESIRNSYSPQTRFEVIHADYHWDNIDDFRDNENCSHMLSKASLKELLECTYRNEHPITYDSFIAPAVRRGFIRAIHWFCKQTDSDKGFEADFLKKFDCHQYFYESSYDLQEARYEKPIIYDLCLDLFNREDGMCDSGDIWPSGEIIDFLKHSEHLIRQAEVVTISLSFGCSGTENDTKQLASLVLPHIWQYRVDYPDLAQTE